MGRPVDFFMLCFQAVFENVVMTLGYGARSIIKFGLFSQRFALG